jgi:hypothetical protein
MTPIASCLAAAVLAATIDVPAGEPIAAAIARARPGDVIRLGPGIHAGALGRIGGVKVEGAGAGATELRAPEGEDGAIVVGAVEITGLVLRAGPARSALKVLGGEARLRDVALVGGAVGAYVDSGRLEGRDLDLAGSQYGLLVRGEASVRGGSARGGYAAVGVLAGTLRLERFAVVGPAREGGISISGGSARLDEVVVRTPGPSGVSVLHGDLDARDLAVSGSTEQGGFLGDCILAIGGEVRVTSSTLDRCGGTALSASGGSARLSGVDAAGGSAGCLVFVDGARVDLEADACTGRGPSVVAGSGARVRTLMNEWRTDPTVWVDCGEGARVELADPGAGRQPCADPR